MADRQIYLDNAATTPMSAGALAAVTDAMQKDWFNPSAMYSQSAELSLRLKQARNSLSAAIHASDGDVIFTSGGTESNNTALFCTRKRKGSRIIVGQGEHDSVYSAAMELKNMGYDVRFAPINEDGSVNEEGFKDLLTPQTSLVSVMHVSNETGAVNDIARLRRLTAKIAPEAIFHSDGVQAFGKIPVNLKALGVDLYSVSAHKIHGPKGVGALYVKKGVSIKPLLFGGGQEMGMRSGTESYPLIAGFLQATSEAMEKLFSESDRLAAYRDELVRALREINDIKVITPLGNAASGILSVAFAGIRGEVLLHTLEEYGVMVGTGSACASHHESRFKRLFELDEAHREGVIRFSFSENNDISEIGYVAECVRRAIDRYKRSAR